jgi:ankyrin repeat protein
MPLSRAVEKANEAVIRVLLKAGVDVNAKSMAGRTALNRAAQEGHTAIALLLLEIGADINREDDLG